MVVIGQSASIMAKVVVFEKKCLLAGKMVVFLQRGCIWAKVVEI